MSYYRKRRSTPRPARWMDLFKPGTCHVCKKDLPAGSRGFWDPETRAITCTELECAEADGLTTQVWYGAPWDGKFVARLNDHRVGRSLAPPAEPNQRVVVTRFAGGGVSYRNTRGRCEDAPCCGCCSA